MQTAEIFKELVQLTERKLRNFSVLKIFIAANNKELGNRYSQICHIYIYNLLSFLS